MKNHYKIIVPFYNVEKWIRKTILSIKHQDQTDFQCVLIDDLSTDNTVEVIKKEIEGDSRFLLLQNEEKKYPFENTRYALNTVRPHKEDIIVLVDGDDWFAHGRVLSTLNKEYERTGCWMTYGSYVEYPSMIRGKFSQPVPQPVIEQNKFRQVPWTTSHLHTFKYGLWANLKKECFIEEEGKKHHFMSAWDLARTYPLLEMAGSKSHYIQEVLYIYNRQNPLNVDKIDHKVQLETENTIRQMEPQIPLEIL